MFNIFTRISRVPSRSKQCFQYISRSYCNEPVDIKNLQKILKLKVRVKNPKTNEYEIKNWPLPIKPRDKNPLDIIKALPADSKDFTEDILIKAYDELSKSPISEEALMHGNFDELIDATERILPKLSVSQNVHIFKQTAEAEIPMYDELTEMIVKSLLPRITHLTIDEIFDLNDALHRYYIIELKISKLFKTLHVRASGIFKLKVNDFLHERQCYEKLIQMMIYLDNNPSFIKSVDTTSLSEQLLLMDDHEFHDSHIEHIILTLNKFPKLDTQSLQLLQKMYRNWCSIEHNIESVHKFLEQLFVEKKPNTDSSSHPDPLFIQRCTEIAIGMETLSDRFKVLHRFNDLNCISTKLIDFLSTVFNTDEHRKLEIDDYGTFCTACKKANYKPSNWDIKVVPAIKQAKLQETTLYKQIELALTLRKLGIHHDDFIKHVLNSAELKQWHKSRPELDEVYKIYSIQKNNESE